VAEFSGGHHPRDYATKTEQLDHAGKIHNGKSGSESAHVARPDFSLKPMVLPPIKTTAKDHQG
jgi:hypothetical protein